MDILDTEYIWCVGIIKKIINLKDNTLLLVHYEGWHHNYDEFIKQSSNRLASLGFYTSRTGKFYLKKIFLNTL